MRKEALSIHTTVGPCWFSLNFAFKPNRLTMHACFSASRIRTYQEYDGVKKNAYVLFSTYQAHDFHKAFGANKTSEGEIHSLN
jgi:hypothetical protein